MLVKRGPDGVLETSWHGQVITSRTILWYVVTFSSPESYMAAWRHILTDTRRNNTVIISSKWPCGAVWMKQWRNYYVLRTLKNCILCPVYEDPIFNGATGCDYLSMPALKLIHVGKTGLWWSFEDIMAWTGNRNSHNSVICNYLFIPLVLHVC